ncbi:hypothetical protein ABT294_17230 [Nonomuraea sp. NPDC000554]|uniref:hypothetical protein n=1 Tax=Nonomuraea sp. NPDC000554 TaxID=3154259 RepID=UPI00331CD5B0
MMVRILAVLCLVAPLFMLSAGAAGARAACSCAAPTAKQRVEEATAVFTATATEVRVDEPTLNGGSLTATLRADHVYKGDVDAEFTVFTRAEGPACGYEFVKGGRYLVFARAQGSGLVTTLCSGNRLLPSGDRPLRLSDATQGIEPLTAELISALGTPTQVRPAKPARAPAPDRTGLVAIVVAAGVVAVAGLAWAYRRARPLRGPDAGSA